MIRADAHRRLRSAMRPLALLVLVGILVAIGLAPAAATPTPTPTSTPSTTGSSPPPGTSGGAAAKKATFGIGPANTKGVDGRPYLNYLASPGSRLTDHVAVLNLATKKVTLSLYVVDATVGTDGAFGYLPKAAPRRDASTWITPDTPKHSTTITLGPRGKAIVPLTIAIPPDAPPGDHAAGIITSVTSKVTGSGTNANFEQRVALRAFIRVSGPLHPSLAVEHLQAQYHGTTNPIGAGAVRLSYTVRNTGNVRLGAHQKVSISGIFGTHAPSKALADVPLLLPGSSVIMSVTVRDVLPQVRLKARVVLYPLIVAGDVDPGVPAQIDATASLWATPWALFVTVAGLLLIVIGLWIWRRRRRRPPAAPPSGRHRGRRPVGPDGDDTSAPLNQPEGISA